MQLGPQLEALAEDRSDLTLRRIDIDSWDSPVARQYQIQSLPHLQLYKDGCLVTSGTQEVLTALFESVP